MKNAPCTPMGKELEAEILAAFPQWLSPREEEAAEEFFQPYLFYQRKSDRLRLCYCTACKEWFHAFKQSEPELFRKKHRERANCPHCQRTVELVALGRMRNFNQLSSREPVVQLWAWRGYLLVQAGHVKRDLAWDYDTIVAGLEFTPSARYAFAPGARMEWKLEWCGSTAQRWTRTAGIGEPFCRHVYSADVPYWPLSLDALGKGPLKWCQYDKWFDAAYGGSLSDSICDGEFYKIAWLIRYLAEYTRRPQLEMLVKLGHEDVVSDLVMRGDPNARTVNWRAREPAAFFRLSRQDYKTFQQMGLSAKQLEHLRAVGKGLPLSEVLRIRSRVGAGFEDVITCARLAGVPLDRAARYVLGWAVGYDRHRAAELWHDYLDAAAKLGYDLTRDDVRLPRDLEARHDAATQAVQAEEDRRLERGYKKRRALLEKQYAFQADGLAVRVPAGVRDIVREGRALEHCVGGYAARHCSGQVTILFLRRAEEPETPYVTIEMSVDPNCARLEIRQIHGFHNDLDREPPRVTHGDFLARWLDWVHAGSPRDADGKPVEAIAERAMVSVA